MFRRLFFFVVPFTPARVPLPVRGQILEEYRGIARVKGSLSQDEKIKRIKKVRAGLIKSVL